MDKALATIFQIQKVLKASGYYDISRLSKEILEYSKTNDLDNILKRIVTGEPWEYICGYGEFRKKNYLLNKDTLIPRIETEQIVDIAKDLIKKSPTPYTDIADIGTGSGCIILSLINELDNADSYIFHATDISKSALDLARRNELNILKTDTVHWTEMNLLEDISFKEGGRILFLANLPYIPTNQYLKLQNCVKGYEPRVALDGGESGVELYLELIDQINKKQLHGTMIIEIEPSTISLFDSLNPRVIKDIYDRNRFLIFSFN